MLLDDLSFYPLLINYVVLLAQVDWIFLSSTSTLLHIDSITSLYFWFFCCFSAIGVVFVWNKACMILIFDTIYKPIWRFSSSFCYDFPCLECRVSSSEAEGNDGIFCSADSINIMDFRHPSGVGLKIQKLGISVQSVFSRGDSIFLGCTSLKSVGKKLSCSQVQQFSLRKQGLFSTYALPESSLHSDHVAITQVWGNSNLVMGVSGQGLFVFDTLRDEPLLSLGCGSTQNVREVIGPDDLYSPSFDHLCSRALLISRDRPALWRHLS